MMPTIDNIVDEFARKTKINFGQKFGPLISLVDRVNLAAPDTWFVQLDKSDCPDEVERPGGHNRKNYFDVRVMDSRGQVIIKCEFNSNISPYRLRVNFVNADGDYSFDGYGRERNSIAEIVRCIEGEMRNLLSREVYAAYSGEVAESPEGASVVNSGNHVT